MKGVSSSKALMAAVVAAILVASLLAGATACAAPGQEGTAKASQAASVRSLRGDELIAAQNARDDADALRAKYEAAYRSPLVRSPEESALFEKVVAAYREAMAKYAGSDIAAYCQVRLAGAYQYRGEYDQAAKQLNDLVRDFRGSKYEALACLEMGLMHLQRRNDPAAAIIYFDAMPTPAGADADGVVPERNYDEAHVMHIGAQQAAAKCEIRLGNPAAAKARYDALSRRYPQYAKGFADSFQFELRSALSDRTLADIKPILAAWTEAERQRREREERETEEKRWGKEVNGLRCAIELKPTALRVGDPFVIDVKIENVADKPVSVYYSSMYQGNQLVIRNEKGEVAKCRTTVWYKMPSPRTFFHLLPPRETFSAQIPGRVTFLFIRAADPAKVGADRPILMDFWDLVCDLVRPRKFTVNLKLSADAKTVEMAKQFGIESPWTGELESNVCEFTVRLMTREELDQTIETLRAGKEEERKEAIEVIKVNADRQAVPALMEILTRATPSPHLRAVSDALVRIQDTSVVPDLLALYRLRVKYQVEDAPELPQILLKTIRSLEADRQKLGELFLEVLKSDAPVEARSYAASELVRLKHPDALVALVETAKKTNPRMQWAAIDALGRLGENTPTETKSTVTAPLVEIMKGDPERTVRERAAMALGPIGDRSVVPALLAALKDPSDFVGAAAAHSLGQLAGPEAIPALEEFAQRASGKSQADAARGAIERIKQRAATP